jgi:hypothetical protein
MTMEYFFFPFLGLLALGGITALAIWFVLLVLPFVLILRKAGYSALWVLVLFFPIIAYIFLWVFALSRWPVEDRRV